MIKKIVFVSLIAFVVSGCAARYERRTWTTVIPAPNTPGSYRCFADGRFDPLGTGRCTRSVVVPGAIRYNNADYNS